jgi:hypothetical protein
MSYQVISHYLRNGLRQKKVENSKWPVETLEIITEDFLIRKQIFLEPSVLYYNILRLFILVAKIW